MTMGASSTPMEHPPVVDLTKEDYTALIKKHDVSVPEGKDFAIAGPARVSMESYWFAEDNPHMQMTVRLPDLPNLELLDSVRLVVKDVQTGEGKNVYNAESSLETE